MLVLPLQSLTRCPTTEKTTQLRCVFVLDEPTGYSPMNPITSPSEV
uniref:Uncharacterized protein n=1 Tax=Anguilla anguilla TaxID=7936 RepID=A0A0E9WAN6_ANGAN